MSTDIMYLMGHLIYWVVVVFLLLIALRVGLSLTGSIITLVLRIARRVWRAWKG
jgi:hypothetical protein